MSKFPTREERFVDHSNYRARKYGVASRLRYADISSLPVGPCVYCGSDEPGWDHAIPLIRGGPNTIDNLARCCQRCNRYKQRRTPDEIANMPRVVTLLCAWCWAPTVRRFHFLVDAEKNGRRHFVCGVECRSRLCSWLMRNPRLAA